MQNEGIQTQEISLWDDVFQTELPTGFEIAAEELIKQKFPYISKSEFVFSNEQNRQIVTFSLLHKELRSEQIESAIREIQRMVAHRYPGNIRDYACCLDRIGVNTGYFSFVTGGIPNGEYHIIFVMAVQDRMMLGTYHCNADYEKQAKDVVLKILKTTKLRKAERSWMIIRDSL